MFMEQCMHYLIHRMLFNFFRNTLFLNNNNSLRIMLLYQLHHHWCNGHILLFVELIVIQNEYKLIHKSLNFWNCKHGLHTRNGFMVRQCNHHRLHLRINHCRNVNHLNMKLLQSNYYNINQYNSSMLLHFLSLLRLHLCLL